jgi:protein-L-isoaspartate(D-aspartate) O-methyltransferase
VAKYSFIDKGIVEFICADGSGGFKKQSPYDKILVSAASSDDIPEELKKQLKIGGRMVCPVQNSIWLLVKKDENKFDKKEYPGFVFVPLV